MGYDPALRARHSLIPVNELQIVRSRWLYKPFRRYIVEFEPELDLPSLRVWLKQNFEPFDPKGYASAHTSINFISFQSKASASLFLLMLAG